jgi:hypothetical protein|tara:strand:+ start:36 stop:347 length:312 start_codon:yes stop_codon:yes gene_type:complete
MIQKQHTKNQPIVRSAKTKALVKKALKNGFKCKPAKGKKYLKDLKIGSVFKVFLLTGILIETTPTAAKVIIMDSKFNDNDNDYYLGKQSIGLETEVVEINLGD